MSELPIAGTLARGELTARAAQLLPGLTRLAFISVVGLVESVWALVGLRKWRRSRMR
jgi:hypothetical protein